MHRILLLICLGLCSSLALAADKKDPKGGAEPATETIIVHKCRQTVSYTWKRVPPKVEEPLGGKKAKAPPAPTPDPDLYSVNEVSALTVNGSGSTVEAAKTQLSAELFQGEQQAKSICQEEHQSPGSCAAKKLAGMGGQFDRLDFDSKRTIQAQIIQDCQLNAGVCLTTKSSEPVCVEEKITAPAAPAAETGKDPKKK